MVGREYKWYVLYTRSQHEKQLYRDFGRLGIESYLPLVPSIRFWSDRKKVFNMPLFPNYLFVRASCREYAAILGHQSVIGFVKCREKPSEVDSCIVDSIKVLIESKSEYCVKDEVFAKGKKVVVVSGPLCGLAGEVHLLCGSSYLIIEVSQVNKSFLVKLDRESVIGEKHLSRLYA